MQDLLLARTILKKSYLGLQTQLALEMIVHDYPSIFAGAECHQGGEDRSVIDVKEHDADDSPGF